MWLHLIALLTLVGLVWPRLIETSASANVFTRPPIFAPTFSSLKTYYLRPMTCLPLRY